MAKFRFAIGVCPACSNTAESPLIPKDPNIVFGAKLTRTQQDIGEVADVAPEPIRRGEYRYNRTLPLIFSPLDPKVLYFGANVLFKTTDQGRSWTIISPDLTRESYEMPANLGAFSAGDPEKGKHRGTIYAVAPSFKEPDTIWAGTDDGLIQLTRDGGKDLEECHAAALTPWAKVSIMEASHFDPGTAYAAVNTFRLDDLAPAHFSHARLRRHLAGNRHRPADECSFRRCARRSAAQGIALCRVRKTPSTFLSMTAIPGNRCSSTCRTRPCAT